MKKVFIILALLSLCSCGAKQTSAPEPQNTKYVVESVTESVTESESVSEADYKTVSFDDLSNDADAFKGEKVSFTGKVVQVKDDLYRIAITQTPAGGYTDAIIIHGNVDAAEGDIITVFGESEGFYNYKSAIGAEISTVKVEAESTRK